MSRVRASVRATRLVSMVIHRRPHCSATYALVPLPQVGSRTRSPGSVVIRTQRFMTSSLVCTTYDGLAAPPNPSHKLLNARAGKSSQSLMNRILFPNVAIRPVFRARSKEGFSRPHHRLPESKTLPSNSTSYLEHGPGLVIRTDIESVESLVNSTSP